MIPGGEDEVGADMTLNNAHEIVLCYEEEEEDREAEV